ncbi:peptidoglycan recognition family protein [Streptomyces albidoflavus]|uniref:N-acetylmuramoyl-L-alanine amidase n=1 Tax=Streptomyces albidoflavus TaxID=1886 RepID=UPI00315A422C
MAPPMTADRFLSALKAEGVTVVEVGSWRTHNRNSKGAWGPVNGVMIHHTVTSGSARTVEICRNGYSGLPGPLCHGVITKDGRVHLVGYGRANHAGSGDDDVLAAVIAEKKLPAANEANTDGNARFYGFECENLGDGKDPWANAQLDAIERVSAAICRVHGWDAASVIGHLEWQPGKVDPRGFTMASMRDRIERRLSAPPGKTPAPTTPDKEPTLADMTAAQVHAAVWGRDAIPSPSTVSTHKTNPTWKAESYLPELVDRISRLTAKVDALAKDVAELKKKGA